MIGVYVAEPVVFLRQNHRREKYFQKKKTGTQSFTYRNPQVAIICGYRTNTRTHFALVELTVSKKTLISFSPLPFCLAFTNYGIIDFCFDVVSFARLAFISFIYYKKKCLSVLLSSNKMHRLNKFKGTPILDFFLYISHSLRLIIHVLIFSRNEIV